MVAGAQPTMQSAQERNTHPAGPEIASLLPTLPESLTSVGQATGHIAAQTGHLLPRNLGPASIISYQGHHWDLRGRMKPGCSVQRPGSASQRAETGPRPDRSNVSPSPALMTSPRIPGFPWGSPVTLCLTKVSNSMRLYPKAPSPNRHQT